LNAAFKMRLWCSSFRIEHENLDNKISARLKARIAERRVLPGERILYVEGGFLSTGILAR